MIHPKKSKADKLRRRFTAKERVVVMKKLLFMIKQTGRSLRHIRKGAENQFLNGAPRDGESMNAPPRKIKASKKLIISLCCVFAALCIVTVTLAWLTQEKRSEHTLVATGVTVEPVVYFGEDGEPVEMDKNGYFSAVLDDPEADDFAGNLKVSIRLKGVTKSYIRVHISDMWVTEGEDAQGNKTETAIFREETEGDAGGEFDETGMNFEDDWLDNRIYDNYVYYVAGTDGERGIIRGELNDDEYEIEIPFLKDLGKFYQYPDGKVYLNIRAEAVQFNRIEQFWGILAPPGA